MLNFKQKLATISIGIIIGGATLAAQHPGTLETPTAGQNAPSEPIDRTAMIKSFAEHEFQVRTQECNTLKHDDDPNAIGECMKTAEAARDSMISGKGSDNRGGGRSDATTQTGMTKTQGGQGEQGNTQQKPEGNSVVDKVKNTVKETWADLTNKNPTSGSGDTTSGMTAGKEGSGDMKGQGMVLQGSGGVALFCQPITNMEPQALNR